MRSILLAFGGLMISFTYGGPPPGGTLPRCFNICNNSGGQISCYQNCYNEYFEAAEEVETSLSTHTAKISKHIIECSKDCATEMGKCMSSGKELKSCLKTNSQCATECMKSAPTVEAEEIEEEETFVSVDQGVCQKNCAIDFSKCLITKFDAKACAQEEAVCALNCLKSVEVADEEVAEEEVADEEVADEEVADEEVADEEVADEEVADEEVEDEEVEDEFPEVEGFKCASCKFAAGKAESIIGKAGCAAGSAAILAVSGPFGAPIVAACPFIAGMIAKKVCSPQKICEKIRFC